MEKLETIVEDIRSEFEAKSAVRDTALQRSRTLIRYCANAIRAAHRGDWAEGEELLTTASQAARELVADLEDYPDLFY
ncbi:MAG: haloacid dehalogenase, partial [Anaerolineae bacterium]